MSALSHTKRLLWSRAVLLPVACVPSTVRLTSRAAMGSVASSLFGHHVHPSGVVETKSGKVRGKTYTLPGLPKVDCFLGIPFGKPPVGELRFKKPVPADDWEDVLDCSKFGPRCHHKDELFEVFPFTHLPSKSEDCLRLNVFVPSGDEFEAVDREAGGRPVLVFVHGGGFCVHSAAHYGDIGMCSTMCKKGVIVVTIQYRLGFFGFFSTGDSEAPGNFGLFDQALALKWVSENIASFGGNPQNVTVCGQSAGGASVDLLSLSPVSRDLFQKVIPMGGNAECVFSHSSGEEVREACMNFAKEKGMHVNLESSKTEQNKALLEFMRAIPAHQLQVGLFGMRGHKINKRKLDLVPVIGDEFLPRPIEQLRKEAPQKTCMVGATKHEGLLFGIRRAFQLSHTENSPEIEELVGKLRAAYVGEEEHSDPKKLAVATIRVCLLTWFWTA
uniref:Carboxylic ester hydrolase n=1 Tax=Steinernema glaseri TaxID=37863 RepID=A0A1I7ZEP8_9BILA